MDDFEYTIGGKTFVQRPLVLGQIEMLAPILLKITTGLSPEAVAGIGEAVQKDASIPVETEIGSFYEIAKFLLHEKRLAEGLAIVLLEVGTKLDERDVAEVEKHLRWTMNIKDGAKVIRDFFTCNDLKALVEMMSEAGFTINAPTVPTET